MLPEKMENCLNFYTLGMIFKYLNGLDLYNASKVCRSWYESAQYILNERNPTCCIRKTDSEHLQKWENVKKEIIDSCEGKPSIHMFFTAAGYMSKLPKGCICQYLPLNCYSISMQKSHIDRNDNTVASMIIPKVPGIKTATVTLNWHFMYKGIYCEELKGLINKSCNAEKLRNIFESFVNNDCYTECCLILFYGYIKIGIINYLTKILKDWFPDEKVSIWGGFVNKLSVCNFVQTSRICQNFVDCACILMTGTDMDCWTVGLKLHNDHQSFEDFKNAVKLKKHSVGFMATPCESSNDHEYEQAFRQSFPNIPLFIVDDSEPLAAEYFKDIYPITKKLPISDTSEITFMMLTYN